QGRAAVDYALYAAPQSREAVSRLGNAAAFKVYMAESTGNLEVPVPRLEEILRAAEAQPKLVVVHAEDPGKFTKQKARDLRGHDAARPKAAEDAAIATLARIRDGARVHVAHVTCLEALNSVPAGATCEVTPHHLFLDSSKPLGARGKVNPPLRSPADILGIAKGTIEVGRDGDLLVVDPRNIETVTAKRVRYKCGWTPFEGMEACFPRAVYLRGETIVEDGEANSEGRGRLIRSSA